MEKYLENVTDYALHNPTKSTLALLATLAGVILASKYTVVYIIFSIILKHNFRTIFLALFPFLNKYLDFYT